MKWTKPILTTMVFASLALGVASGVVAGDPKPREQDVIRDALRRGEILSLAQVLNIAERHAPGEILEVELETKKHRLIYEIKILSREGQVQKVKLDARTGALLKIEDD